MAPPRRQAEPSTSCRALFSEPPALSRRALARRLRRASPLDLTELSGLLQNFFHLVRIVQRVHRRVGEKLCANHGEREAAQVNSPVGKLLGQLRGDARPVTAHDSNGMEGTRNVKTHLRGCSNFPVTPEWRDEHYSFAGFCAPGDDKLQVCARIPQLSQQIRKTAGSVFDGRRPHIDMFHIFHERIHNSSPSSQLLCAKCNLGHNIDSTTPAKISYIHSDILGSTDALTNAPPDPPHNSSSLTRARPVTKAEGIQTDGHRDL